MEASIALYRIAISLLCSFFLEQVLTMIHSVFRLNKKTHDYFAGLYKVQVLITSLSRNIKFHVEHPI